jgi:hypothetical protein
MKTLNKILLAVCLTGALAFSTGCDPEDNVVAGYLYEEVGGNFIVSDQFGNSLQFTGDQADQLLSMEPSRAAEFVAARFQSTYPESYTDGQVPELTTEVAEPSEVVVSDTAGTVTNALGYIPVWGDLASLVANGILGIGAVWLGRRKKTAEKINESLVKGIDTFRDVLDQTDQGEVIDAELTRILKDYQNELKTADEVVALLKRFATPTKAPIPFREVE